MNGQRSRLPGLAGVATTTRRILLRFPLFVEGLRLPLRRIREASGKPRKEYAPKPRTSLDFSISENHNGGIHGARSPGETLVTHALGLNHEVKLVLVWIVPSGVRET